MILKIFGEKIKFSIIQCLNSNKPDFVKNCCRSIKYIPVFHDYFTFHPLKVGEAFSIVQNAMTEEKINKQNK